MCLCGVQRSMLFLIRLELLTGTYACDFSEAVAPCSQGIFRVDILIRLRSLKVRLRRCFVSYILISQGERICLL